MSMRYPGGLIASTPVNAAYPSGVWTPTQSLPYQQQNVWTRDQYWPYTTLLLQGNGTNGDQNNTFLDSGPTAYTITRNGNATQGAFTPYDPAGYWSAYFDGTGDYLTTLTSPANFYLGTNDFTVEAWVFHTAVSEQCVIYYGTPSSGSIAATDIGWAIDTYNNIPRFLFYSSSTQVTVSSGQTMVANQWVHYAVSRSGSSIKFFINGQQAGSTVTSSDSVNTKPKFTARIGLYGPYATDRYFNGYISNLRVINGTALYTSNFSVSATPPTAVSNTAMLSCNAGGFTGTSNVSGQASNAVYSSTLTSSGVFDENYPATAAFDGSLTTAASGRDGGETNTWNAIPYNLTATTSLRIYSFGGGGNWYVNGSNQGTVSSSGWYSYTGSYPVTITQIQTTNPGSTGMFAAAIEVDGIVLTNKPNLTANGDTKVQSFQPFPGSTTWSASVLGGSGYFDGNGDYVAFPNQSISLGSGACSVEFWCYITGEPTTNPFLFDNYGNSSARLFAYYDGTTMYLGATGTTRTTTFNYNSWNFFQFVRSGGTGGWYLNGTLISTTFSSSGTIDLQRMTIGAAQESGTINSNQWTQGYITSFRASNTNRSTTVPTSPFTSDGNTVALLNFTNAGIFDGAMQNDLETVGNAQVSTSVVKYGTGSMYFDGNGDYLKSPDSPALRLSTGDFTVEAWVYLTGNQPQFDGGVASYGATTTSAGWTVAITGSSAGGTLNRLVYGVNASAAGGAPLYGVAGIPLNTWTHIAVTKSGATVRMFINGSLDTSGTVTATPNTSTSYSFYVGTQAYDPTATTRQFAGYIDDFRITNGYARYISNFTPPPARFPAQ